MIGMSRDATPSRLVSTPSEVIETNICGETQDAMVKYR